MSSNYDGLVVLKTIFVILALVLVFCFGIIVANESMTKRHRACLEYYGITSDSVGFKDIRLCKDIFPSNK